MSIKMLNENELILVDDDEMELHLAKRYVAKSNVKNELLAFDGGQPFLDHLDLVLSGARKMPSLVLMDIRMPGMDGFEVVRRVRDIPGMNEMPILLMFSNSNDESDINKAKEIGADGYQVKPEDGEAYVSFLNSLI